MMMMMMVMVTIMVNICDYYCYLVMKVILVKEVMSCDISPVAMFTNKVDTCCFGAGCIWQISRDERPM